jgi:hypothetical protein
MILTSNTLVAHPFPKVIFATSLKLAFVPSCPGFLPTMVAHRLSKYNPKIEVLAENKHEMIPGMRPIEAKAEGKANAPAPIIVFARLETDETIVACPSGISGGDGAADLRGVRRETCRDRWDLVEPGVAPYAGG